MFFAVLFVAILLVAIILCLPYFSGLVTYKVDKSSKKKSGKKAEVTSPQASESYGYIPPDEQFSKSTSVDRVWNNAKLDTHKINVTSEDIPIKLRLLESSGLKRRNKEKLDLDSNPNKYDYDIDDLIKEESELALEEQKREFYRNTEMGKDKEAMV